MVATLWLGWLALQALVAVFPDVTRELAMVAMYLLSVTVVVAVVTV
jgi:hypothetical protein